MDAYYTPEQMKQFEAAGKATPQEEIGAIEEAWTTLLAEVRAARAADLDPASAEAGSLADRWVELSGRTMQHFPDDLREAIKANYERGAFEGHDRGMLCGKRNRLSGSHVRLTLMSCSRF
jgi:hypothetical protein